MQRLQDLSKSFPLPIYGLTQIIGDQGSSLSGIVTFKQTTSGCEIKGVFYNLPKGKHGIHIHEYGNLKQGCQSCGAHYNPFNKTHGGPLDVERHVGDLGNVESNGDYETKFELNDELISLGGEFSIFGRSVVIHQDEDDLGRGGFQDSKTTGHAGKRIGCGVIGVCEKF